MKINADVVKKLRIAKNWSQEQLGEMCGLSLRTIQRLENSGNASIESVRVLAAAFDIDSSELILSETEASPTPLDAVKIGLSGFANFNERATRFEFWWFLLFVVGVLAISTILHEKVFQIASVVLLLPLLAASTRRLKDAGQSPWWLMFWFVPFGQIVLFYFLALPSSSQIIPTAPRGIETVESI